MNVIPPYIISPGSLTRASTATYFDAAGVLVTAAVDQPRYNHDPSTVTTNLLRYSEDFSAIWTRFGTCTVTSNVVSAPDGTMSADRVTIPASSSIYQIVAGQPNLTYTDSIYLRADTACTVRLYLINDAGPIYTTANVTTSWQRFSFTRQAPSNATYVSLQMDTIIGATYIYAWGGQMEIGSAPTTYVKTTSTTAYYPAINPTLLVENTATNSVLYSNNFDNASWVKLFTTVSPNVITGITGTTTVDKLVESSTNNVHEAYQSFAESNIVRCASVVAKAGERGRIKIAISNFVNASVGAVFDLINGVVVAVDVANSDYTQPVAAITELSGGSYLCEFSARKGNFNTVNVFEIIIMRDTDAYAQAYLGDGTSGVYLEAAQFEVGTKATSRIVTSSAAVTRAADVLSAGMISTVPEPDTNYSEIVWTPGTYVVGEKRILTTTHRIYQCAVGGLRTISPDIDVNYWVDVGPTNRWAMFDTYRNSATKVPIASSIIVTLDPRKRINSVAILQMSKVINLTISVDRASNPGVIVYSKAFTPNQNYLEGYILFDLPPYIDLRPTITFNCSAGASIGALIIGKYTYIGDVQNNPTSSATNYSTISRDSFGNTTLLPRRNVPRTSQTLFISPELIDNVKKIRADLNGVPAVWSGMNDDYLNNNFKSLLIMGFYTNFNIVADSSVGATIELELEEI